MFDLTQQKKRLLLHEALQTDPPIRFRGTWAGGDLCIYSKKKKAHFGDYGCTYSKKKKAPHNHTREAEFHMCMATDHERDSSVHKSNKRNHINIE